MRKQQQIWEAEHRAKATLPGMASPDPSQLVVAFYEFLARQGAVGLLRVVDIGCGKGRNAVYLAKQGYDVSGIDYIQGALDYAKNAAQAQGVNQRTHFIQVAIDRPWPFADDFFDIAVDCYSSIDIETHRGREMYRRQLYRTLKPAGFVLVTVPSAEDELEKELIRTSPGKEKNSTIWPSGKFQKDYDETELREFYKDFKIIEVKKIVKPAYKLNHHYTSTNFSLILQKPAQPNVKA